MKKTVSAVLLTVLFTGCSTHKAVVVPVESVASTYQLTDIADERIEMDSRFDAQPSAAAIALLENYKQRVDDIMSPVVGESTHAMVGQRDRESDLANLVADVLRYGSEKYTGKKADLGLINFGGLRNSLPGGKLTFGSVFEVLPFENTLVIMKMKGTDVIRLFRQICVIRDGGFSGANIVSKNRELQSVRIAGEEVQPDKVYTLATVDYVAEGNDGFTVLKEITDWEVPEGATVRQCMLDYIAEKTARGEKIDAQVEGRFIQE